MELNTDLLKQFRQADKEDREFAKSCAILIASPQFASYRDRINRAASQVGEQMLEPAGGLDGAFRTEYQKGIMRGLILARDLAELCVNEMKAATTSETDDDDDE